LAAAKVEIVVTLEAQAVKREKDHPKKARGYKAKTMVRIKIRSSKFLRTKETRKKLLRKKLRKIQIILCL